MPNYIKLGNLRIEIPQPAIVDPGDGGGNNGGGGGSSSLLTGLLAFYNLSDLTDASGNGNTLTNNGGVDFVNGKIGSAADFDGSNYFTGPNFNGYGDTFTVSGWINTPLTEESWIAAQYPGFIIGVRDDGSIVVSDLQSWDEATSAGLIDAGDWYHVVCRVVNGLAKVYLNNSLVLEVTDTGRLLDLQNGTRGFGISGDSGAGNQGECKIDALGIWNRALTDAEVAELYNAGAGKEHPFA
jgi:hypothetical protein